MYKIKIDFETGNSFGSEEYEDFIEYEWSNLKMAKESLQRIKNHYKVYQETDGYRKPKQPTPEGVIWDTELKYVLLELISDDGVPFRYSSFWTGYFEILYSAEIIVNDTDMKFIV